MYIFVNITFHSALSCMSSVCNFLNDCAFGLILWFINSKTKWFFFLFDLDLDLFCFNGNWWKYFLILLFEEVMQAHTLLKRHWWTVDTVLLYLSFLDNVPSSGRLCWSEPVPSFRFWLLCTTLPPGGIYCTLYCN